MRRDGKLFEEAGAMANSLEAQFQLTKDPSEPVVIEIGNEAMQCKRVPFRSGSKFTSLSEVQKVIKPAPNGVLNIVVRHLPNRDITFLTKVITAVLRRK
jgi:hypothetical protein